MNRVRVRNLNKKRESRNQLVRDVPPLRTHLCPDCNAGRWSSLRRRERWRRLLRWSTRPRCVCQLTQTTVPAQTSTLITRVGAVALLQCSAASLVARSRYRTSSRAADGLGRSSCGSAGGSGRRRRVRSERESTVVYVAYGVLCALLALLDALLTVEGGNSTPPVPSRPLPLVWVRQGCFGRYGRAYGVRN